jgi:hypothetical protein
MPATCRLANPAAFPRERQGTVRGCRWHHTRCRRNQASPIRAPCSCPIVAAAATPGRQARAGCPISPLRTERGILFGPLVLLGFCAQIFHARVAEFFKARPYTERMLRRNTLDYKAGLVMRRRGEPGSRGRPRIAGIRLQQLATSSASGSAGTRAV